VKHLSNKVNFCQKFEPAVGLYTMNTMFKSFSKTEKARNPLVMSPTTVPKSTAARVSGKK